MGMRNLFRYQGVSLSLITMSALLVGATMVRAQETSAGQAKTQPYFAPKHIAIVTATSLPGKNGKGPDSRLAVAAANELRSLFFNPTYQAVPDAKVFAAMKSETLAALPPAQVPTALRKLRNATQADIVVYALVRDATSQQVTLQLWVDDPTRTEGSADGLVLRREKNDYPKTESPGVAIARGKDPTFDKERTTTMTLSPMDSDQQATLIRRMLEDWNTTRKSKK